MGERVLRVGHSPDADDAFMFFGLASGAVRIQGFRVEHVMEDIETLNRRARAGELEVTAISAHAYPALAAGYRILASGASMGEGYGPVLVARRSLSLAELAGRRVATPGRMTTAHLLCRLYLERVETVEMPFDRILEAVVAGEAEAGVIIHEGQLTFDRHGLSRVCDFGQLWCAETGLPLPLGLDVVRRDLGPDVAGRISMALRDSIRWAFAHEEEALDYALQFGRGLDREEGRRFVRMYVSGLTLEMGQPGREALELLFRRAAERGLIEFLPPLDLI